ncbi:16S rRNA (cytosine(1402)-N(4))-methyltransferase RsmH [Candidatus Dependentiae bacterium]|nr:16S rRNA (cytosine(1402)-N(4))-methyltransferase RsmH [Candidatus Dependentiae bacterium]
MMNDTQGHKTVLLEETVQALDPKPGEIYVDATLGGAGHTRAILLREPRCKVIGLDWDKSVIDTTGAALAAEFPERFFPVYGNFAKITELVARAGFTKVHGIIADFGTSQIQIRNTPGFSVHVDSYLDMRFSPGMFYRTAYDVVNRFKEDDLADIFFNLGGESRGRKIARAIIQARSKKKIETTFQLVKIIEDITPGSYHKIHPATKAFQALRIYVNQELENIESFLQNSMKVLHDGGRLVCISFHSLEDRIVKHFFRDNDIKKTESKIGFQMITKKACMASEQELDQNRSARSARLRAGILRI